MTHRPTLSAIDYGKGDIGVYRFAAPTYRVPAIPESPFTGRAHDLFAAEVGVQVLGGPFAAAYTEGDNRNVVATDTMKNFVLKHALAFEGATLEAFLDSLGRAFFEAYPDMETLRLTGREVPFAAAPVRQGETFVPSPVLLSRSRGDCGAAALQTGTGELTGYVASEQVRDLLAATFHDVNSRSIQHLVYEMGVRLLARFPQLREVRFEAQNRLWDHAFSDDETGRKVHTDPRPPYGRIGLTLTA